MKEKATEIMADRIGQIAQASNVKELENFEYFAHGAADAMWELGIFNQPEHTGNYDAIVAAGKKRLEELKCR